MPNNSNIASVAHILSPSDMQLIVAAAMGQHFTPVQLPALVEAGLSGSPLKQLNEKTLKVKAERLVEKLRHLTPRQLEDLAAGVNQALSLDVFELFGGTALPSIHVLRREGLVVPASKPAWGFCVVNVVVGEGERYHNFYQEIVLRHDPRELNLETRMPVDQIAAMLVEVVKLEGEHGGSRPTSDLVYSCCLHLAASTGWPHFRVDEAIGAKPLAVVQLKPDLLLRDIQAGDLKGLTLAGINAPAF